MNDIKTVKVTNAPSLAHDKLMSEKYQSEVGPRGKLERKIVWNLCAHMVANGWTRIRVYDGERMTLCKDSKHALELIFDLDEVSLRFSKNKGAPEHGVLLVIGEGEDIISDWNYSDGDGDKFNATMEAFDSDAISYAAR